MTAGPPRARGFGSLIGESVTVTATGLLNTVERLTAPQRVVPGPGIRSATIDRPDPINVTTWDASPVAPEGGMVVFDTMPLPHSGAWVVCVTAQQSAGGSGDGWISAQVGTPGGAGAGNTNPIAYGGDAPIIASATWIAESQFAFTCGFYVADRTSWVPDFTVTIAATRH